MSRTTLEILESRINRIAEDNLKMPDNWKHEAFIDLRIDQVLEFLQNANVDKRYTIKEIINNDWCGIKNMVEPYRQDLLRKEKEKAIDQIIKQVHHDNPDVW